MQGGALSCVSLNNMKEMGVADFVGWIEKMHMYKNKALKKKKESVSNLFMIMNARFFAILQFSFMFS